MCGRKQPCGINWRVLSFSETGCNSPSFHKDKILGEDLQWHKGSYMQFIRSGIGDLPLGFWKLLFSPWIRNKALRNMGACTHMLLLPEFGGNLLHLLTSILKCVRAAWFPWPHKGRSQERDLSVHVSWIEQLWKWNSFSKKKKKSICLTIFCVSAELDKLCKTGKLRV